MKANDYFKFHIQLNGPIAAQDLNSNIRHLNDVIYNYFFEHYGNVEITNDKKLLEKYENHTVKDLKRCLKELKSTGSQMTEIKHVSHILRERLRNHNNKQQDHIQEQPFNHDKFIERNFWGYVKVLKMKDAVLPSFSSSECLSYFTKTLTAINPNKMFRIPNWIPALSDPQVQFDLDPPSYQQITTTIRRMKASGSPCPLDQISILCFKRCPYLRHT